MKRKITVTTGTRAEYGIIKPVLKSISKNKKLELHLLVTGTHLSKNHGMSINEIKKDGFKISEKFSMLPHGNTNYHMSLNIAKGIEQFSKIFRKIRPDINLVLGDRDEMLASTISAYHMNIPNGFEFSVWMLTSWMFHAHADVGHKAVVKNQDISFPIRIQVWQAVIRNGEIVPK